MSIIRPIFRTRSKEALLWLALLSFSLIVAWLLKQQGFPAAFLVGPMLCGIVFGLLDMRLSLPRRLFQFAQSLIGCTVANSITVTIVVTILNDWPAMLLIVGSAVLAGGLVGWALVKSHALPGTTAAWGSTPGAASAMVAMAEEHGADSRLVALMQYLRVLIVVLTASAVTHFLLVPGQAAAVPMAAPGSDSWRQLLPTLLVAVAGGWIGKGLRIPTGVMLVPMVLGAVLHATGFSEIYMPFWLQACASILLGWYVGLGFDRKLLTFSLGLLPRLLLSTVFLIVLCGVSAWLVMEILHTDPLTAFLSTSPGGLDSVILIAVGSQANIPFVVAVQTLRLFVVILTGPGIARFICRHA